MSEIVDISAELAKLARVTGLPVSKLEHLAVVGAKDLRAFRYQVIDQLFAYNEGKLKNLAAASKLVPVPIIAKLAPMYFEPKLAAAMAGLVDEDKSVKLMSKLPLDYLTACSPHVDPRKIGGIAAKISPELTAQLAPALVAMDETITIGQFVDFVTPEILEATLPVLDDVSLLKIATYAENKEKLNDIIPLIWGRIPSVFFAASEHGMWSHALNLFTEIKPELRVRLADMAAQMPDTILGSLVRAAHKEHLYGLFLPMTASMSKSALQRFGRVKELQDPEVLTALTQAAHDSQDWVGLLSLGAYLPGESAKYIAGVATTHRKEVVAAALTGDNTLAGALHLSAYASPTVQRAYADAISSLPGPQIDAAVRATVRIGRMPQLLPLVDLMPAAARARVTAAAAALDSDEMKSALVQASEGGHLPAMLNIAAEMPAEARTKVTDVIAANAEDDLLGSNLDEAGQQEVLASLLKVAQGASASTIELLSQQISLLNVESIAPGLLQAADLTGAWDTGLALFNGLQKQAELAGVTIPMNAPEELLKKAQEIAADPSKFIGESVAMAQKVGGVAATLGSKLLGALTKPQKD
ncbi:hypothetical protein [Smaragdicoccus niigatensis]|uniref:hypothetical protein n=1 Tax=Smaragdicoccus niigatensis TaxID=359359 RepID=UPI0003611639|nr:hypothetical protein [Smaragdicoccus niigatensis]